MYITAFIYYIQVILSIIIFSLYDLSEMRLEQSCMLYDAEGLDAAKRFGMGTIRNRATR